MIFAAVFHKNSQLVLPVLLSACQILHVFMFNLLNKLNRHVGVPTAPHTSIMRTKPPNLIFHFLLVVRVSQFKFSFAFSNILPKAFFTSYQINNPVTVTVNLLLDFLYVFFVLVLLKLLPSFIIGQDTLHFLSHFKHPASTGTFWDTLLSL